MESIYTKLHLLHGQMSDGPPTPIRIMLAIWCLLEIVVLIIDMIVWVCYGIKLKVLLLAIPINFTVRAIFILGLYLIYPGVGLIAACLIAVAYFAQGVANLSSKSDLALSTITHSLMVYFDEVEETNVRMDLYTKCYKQQLKTDIP